MMFNDPFVTLLCKEDGLTTVEITERLGKTDTHTNRQNTYKKLWTLRKYGIVCSERINEDKRYNLHYLTESTRRELDV